MVASPAADGVSSLRVSTPASFAKRVNYVNSTYSFLYSNSVWTVTNKGGTVIDSNLNTNSLKTYYGLSFTLTGITLASFSIQYSHEGLYYENGILANGSLITSAQENVPLYMGLNLHREGEYNLTSWNNNFGSGIYFENYQDSYLYINSFLDKNSKRGTWKIKDLFTKNTYPMPLFQHGYFKDSASSREGNDKWHYYTITFNKPFPEGYDVSVYVSTNPSNTVATARIETAVKNITRTGCRILVKRDNQGSANIYYLACAVSSDASTNHGTLTPTTS